MANSVKGRLLNTDLQILGEAFERLPIVHDRSVIYVKSSSYTYYTSTGKTSKQTIDGTAVSASTVVRGITLTRLDEFGNLVDSNSYSYYSSIAVATSLGDVINSTPLGYTLIFTTFDEPYAGITQYLKTALKSLNLRLLDGWGYRCAWAAVVQKGSDAPLYEDYMDGDSNLTTVESTVIIPKGIIHFPFDNTSKSIQGILPYKYAPESIRYIRDWCGTSTVDNTPYWSSISALDVYSNNLSLNKTIVTNTGSSPGYAILDLLDWYKIKSIVVSHYPGDTRTFSNTKTEVSVDGINWYPIYDSSLDGTYAESPSGKTINLFNNYFSFSPNGSGIAVEKSATNIWGTDGVTISNGYATNNEIIASLSTLSNEKFLDQPIYRESMTPTTSAALTHIQTSASMHGVRSLSSKTFTSTTCYSVSIYWRAVNKSDITLSLTPSNIGYWYDLATVDVGNGWKRSIAIRKGDSPTTGTDYMYFAFKCPSAILNEPIIIDWACPQLESDIKYATSYTHNSRPSGASGIYIPIVTSNFPFSVTMKVIPNIKDGSNSGYGSEPSNMYIASLWKPKDGGGYWGEIDQVPRSSITGDLLNGFLYTIIFYSETHFETYINSTRRVNSTLWTNDGTTLANVKYICIGSRGYQSLYNVAEASYSDVTIYNRVLTSSELTKLSNLKFQLDDYGNIYDNIIERPVAIPDDAYLFRLGNDVSDEYDYVSAIDSANAIYDDCGILAGPSYTNLVTNPLTMDSSTWTDISAGETITYKTADPFKSSNAINIHPTGTTDNYFGLSTSLPIGTYVVSIWLKATKNITIPIYIGGNTFSQSVTVSPKWQKFVFLATTTSAGYTIRIGGYNSWAINTIDISVAYPQVVKFPYLYDLPFVNGSSGNSKIGFNLNTSIGLDWSGDWTIMFSKKPISTSTGDLTGRNIDLLGSPDNNVGLNYMSFGKNISANAYILNLMGKTTVTPTGGALTTDNYFGKWQICCLRKLGSIIYYNIMQSDGTMDSTLISGVSLPSNAFVSQYGFDLHLAGATGVYYGLSYYRDLIVCKRCITGSETFDYMRNRISEYKNNTYIFGEILETPTLS